MLKLFEITKMFNFNWEVVRNSNPSYILFDAPKSHLQKHISIGSFQTPTDNSQT